MKMRLQVVDRTIPISPEMPVIERMFWKILSGEDLGVDPGNEHFFEI